MVDRSSGRDYVPPDYTKTKADEKPKEVVETPQIAPIAPSLALILRKVFAAIILWLVSMRDKLRG